MDVLDGMRTFVASVEAGSFTAAADRLGRSNKLVSKYVAELEARLGVRLLHRTTRSLGPTDAGRRYYEGCVEVLGALEALEASLHDEDRAIGGTLRLSAPTTFGATYVQPLLRRFRRSHPRLTIDLRLSDRFDDLAEDGFDLAIRIGALDASSLIARKLGQTELWAVATPAYVAGHGAPDLPRDLLGHACIRDTNLRSGQSWTFEVAGKPQKIPVSGPYLVNSAQLVSNLVIAGEGIGLCPDYVVAADVAAGRLVRLLAGFPSLSLDVHAVYIDGRRQAAKTRRLLDFLAREFRSHPDWTGLVSGD